MFVLRPYQETCLPIGNDLGRSADGRGDRGYAGRCCLEDYIRQSLGKRWERNDIRPRKQGVQVIAKAREPESIPEPQLGDA